MFFVNFITMLYLKRQIQKDREETYTVNTIHRKSPMLTGYEYVENIDISFSTYYRQYIVKLLWLLDVFRIA